ncbi:MAG TPA: cadherin repeat domain-containing protein, partial [Kofleriaceae bacterium]|nr:cadherin repeat domain-containing protein [Kofleriaceae bacterium]
MSTGGDGDGAGSDGGSDGPNDPPTDIELSASEVEEQAPPGSPVGVLSAADADASDSHTFELVDDGGGLFAIDGDRLEVAPGAILNYETGARVTVTVQATDDGGLGVEKQLEISILDLREVVNTDDSGPGSLRQAIADAEPGETILFETGLDSQINVNSV